MRLLPCKLAILLTLSCTGLIDSTPLADAKPEPVDPVIDPTGPLDDTRFGRAMEVLRTNCASCHVAGGPTGATSFAFTHESQFISAGLVVAGKVDESKLLYRLRNFPVDNGARNMPSGSTLRDADYVTLTDWVSQIEVPVVVVVGSDAGVVVTSDGGVASVVNAFECQPNEAPSQQDAKRLTRAQYRNALESLFSRALGATDTAAMLTQVNVLGRIPVEGIGSYTTSDTNFSVIHATEYFNVADLVSTSMIATANYSRFVTTFINYAPGTCVVGSVDSLNADCQNTLIRNFLLRAWGRPVEQGEANTNNELASFQREFQLAASSRAGVEAMVMKALMSPQFLFHLQIDLRNQQGTIAQLSSHAIARNLAFAFTQTLPDETLLAMATRQDLGTDAPFAAAVTYLSERMDPTITQFTREWLRLDALPAFAEQTHPKFLRISQGVTADDALKVAMRNEVVELMTYIAKADRPMAEALTTNISFARNPSLMRIYGQTTPAPAVVTEANAVRFARGERSGFLTRAAMLVSGGHSENPILRGVRIRRNILCLPLRQPMGLPPDALALPELDPHSTTRERFHRKTSGEACVGCHSLINPLGFPFSRYNALGGYQTTEPVFTEALVYSGELPTDSRSNLLTALGLNRTVEDGNEFSSTIADGSDFKSCFTKNFYAYANGLQELPQTAVSCDMNQMFDTLAQGGSMKSFFKSSVHASRFSHRTVRR